MGTPIPQPPGYPLLGNIKDIDPENLLASIEHLVNIYGRHFSLALGVFFHDG